MSIPIYTSEQMRQWDQFTIDNEPIESIDLMERAASFATKSILGRNQFNSVAIFCGPGNNGGDGLVIARLLSEAGKLVQLFCLKFGTDSTDFETNFKRLPKNIDVVLLTKDKNNFTSSSDLIVDAIFGSGLDRSVEGWIAKVIDEINKSDTRTISIDLPSGLFSGNNNENSSFPSVIKANETLTFMTPKMPFFFSTYSQYIGEFRIIDIGLSSSFSADTLGTFVTIDDISLDRPEMFVHKGSKGFLTLIAGYGEMTGAAIISSMAGMKSGVGYVNTACDISGRSALNVAMPEVVWQDIADFHMLDKTTAIAIGPGLGTSDKAKELLHISFGSNKPLVIDADAINLLAAHPDLLAELPKDSILTPHMGELKRLLGEQTSDEKYLEAQIAFSKAHGVFVLQKGAFSKLTTPDGNVIVNSSGNPGMATAGMGDALTGLIGSLLAQGYAAETSATFGMFLHGYAGDEHAKNVGEIGLLATDVIAQLPHVINKFSRT